MKIKPSVVLSALAAASIAACGGGGGGSSSPPTYGASTAGTVGKGILIGAKVEALEVSGGTLASRGTATTNTEGDYSLSISGYSGGPLLIKISHQTNALMKCDVQAGCANGEATAAFGTTLPLPSDFALRTMVPSLASGDALTRCITPLTELAVSRAAELAGRVEAISADNVRSAFSEVSNLAGGLDVQRTCLVDITNPAKVAAATPDQLAVSGLAAAVLAVNGGTPTAAITAMNAAFTGGTIGKTALDGLVTAARTELQAVKDGAQNNAAYLQIAQTVANTQGDTVDPQPGSTANASLIAQGKALIDEVRGLVRSLENDVEGAGSNAVVTTFAQEIDTAAAAADAQPLFEAFALAVDTARAFYAEVPDGESDTYVLPTVDSNGADVSATITVNKPAQGNHSVTIVGTVTDYTTDLALAAPADVAAGGDFTAATSGTMASASGEGLSAEFDVDVSLTELSFNADGSLAALDAANFDGTLTFAQIGVTDPVSFTGTVAVKVVECSTCARVDSDQDGAFDDDYPGNIDLLTLAGTFSRSDAELGATITIDMDAASVASFDPRLPVSADNVPSGQVSIQTNASLDGFHSYAVALTLTLNDITSLNGGQNGNLHNVNGTIVAILSRDTQTITITATAQPPTQTANVFDLRIANQDGVSLTADDVGAGTGPVIGTIRVGSTAVGTLEETSNGLLLIRWSDGTIESLG